MLNTNFNRLHTAAALSLAALTCGSVAPAHAQTLHLSPGSYTASDSTYENGAIYIGLDPAASRTDGGGVPYVAALGVVDGGVVDAVFGYNTNTLSIGGGNVTTVNGNDSSTTNIGGGSVTTVSANNTSTINVSGGTLDFAYSNNDSNTNIDGGNVDAAYGLNSSTTNIRGGSVNAAFGQNTSTLAISGGTVNAATAENDSTLFISGGTIAAVYGANTSALVISGGTLTSGILIRDSDVTADFVGAGLTFSYTGYGDSNPYNTYADSFSVTGTVGGASRTYELYISNVDAFGGATAPNTAPRQFTFNAGAPVAAVVPEAGTLALILPALGMVGAVVVRRRVTNK